MITLQNQTLGFVLLPIDILHQVMFYIKFLLKTVSKTKYFNSYDYLQDLAELQGDYIITIEESKSPHSKTSYKRYNGFF